MGEAWQKSIRLSSPLGKELRNVGRGQVCASNHRDAPPPIATSPFGGSGRRPESLADRLWVAMFEG